MINLSNAGKSSPEPNPFPSEMSFLLSPFRSVACGRVCASPATVTRAFSTTRSAQLARLTLVGRLGTDPEITTTSSGNEVIKYVVGTSYGPKENRQTSWFRVASFAEKESPIREKIMGLSKGYVDVGGGIPEVQGDIQV